MGEYANTPAAASSPPKAWSKFKILLFGQCLSVLLASVWASQSTMFLTCEWNAPAFSCLWVYFVLSFNLIPVIIRNINRDKEEITPSNYTFLKIVPLQSTPWLYACFAVLLFYGNFLSLIAIRYTTITSISMIDAVSIPTVMILSRCCLHRKYVMWHIIAASVCMIGILVNMVVDLRSDREVDKDMDRDGSKEYPHKIVGDLCALTAGILFGVNDVLTESTVRKNAGISEYLGMIGFFGTFVSIFQMCITERAAVVQLFKGDTSCAPWATAGLLIVFVIGEAGRKFGIAYFLTISEAALLQMSLLTSDVYTAIFSIIIQGFMPHGLFWVASTLVVSGILVYELGPSPIVVKKTTAPEVSVPEILQAIIPKGDVV
jgi:solute carrier family 35 protein F1/2